MVSGFRPQTSTFWSGEHLQNIDLRLTSSQFGPGLRRMSKRNTKRS